MKRQSPEMKAALKALALVPNSQHREMAIQSIKLRRLRAELAQLKAEEAKQK